MKRTDLLIKVITLLVFTALVAYVGFSVYEVNENPVRTVNAAEWEVSDSAHAEGYAVRVEKRILSGGGNIYISVEDGAKVAAGQTVAVSYSGAEALERAERLRAVDLEIAHLEALLHSGYSDEAGEKSVIKLAQIIARGDMDKLGEVALELNTNVFSSADRYTDDEIKDRLAELRAEREQLSGASASDTHEIYVPYSGTFSARTDGFENVTPESVMGILPSDLDSLFKTPAAASNSCGKLVTGIEWYFAAKVDAADAERLSVGDKVVLEFSRTYSESVEMTVESIGKAENGKRVAVFSCKRFLQDVVSQRELTAEIIFSRESGIRVPREAMRLDEDGRPFVYVLVEMQAKKAYVKILAESGDFYLAEPEDGILVSGAQIITKANDLSGGKVVL